MGKDNIEKTLLKNDIEIVLKKCSKEDIIEYYQDKVLSFNDADLAYWFAMHMVDYDFNTKKFSKVIINSKNLRYNYEFARYIKGADLKGHEKVILNSKDVEYNYSFASTIKGADIKKHEKIILESKDLYYICNFASSIPDADIKKCEEIIFNKSNIDYLYYIYFYGTILDENKLDKYSTEKIVNIILESENEELIHNFYNKRKDILERYNKIVDYEKFISQKEELKKVYKYE